MIYLTEFKFPSNAEEGSFLFYSKKAQMTCFDSAYPFNLLSEIELGHLQFNLPITILYGSNGCGKSTVLNVIAQKLKLSKKTLYSRTPFFDDFLDLCDYKLTENVPSLSSIITSDDIFQHLQSIRNINQSREIERNRIFNEYDQIKLGNHKEYKSIDFNNEASMEKYNRYIYIKNHSKSCFAKANVGRQIREYSNGESAMAFLQENIQHDALYILDEPENNMSPFFQKELAEYIEECAIDYNCQFIIATHSPFLLAMENSKIYDMDDEVVSVKNWEDLENIKIYRELFK